MTVPTTAGHVKRDGIVVHRQRLPAEHVTTHRGIPVTTPIRTLLDYAAVASLNALFRAFEQAQVHLHIPPAPIAAEVIARPRRAGNGKLRKVLEARSIPRTSARCSRSGSCACAPRTASAAEGQRPHGRVDAGFLLAGVG